MTASDYAFALQLEISPGHCPRVNLELLCEVPYGQQALTFVQLAQRDLRPDVVGYLGIDGLVRLERKFEFHNVEAYAYYPYTLSGLVPDVKERGGRLIYHLKGLP